MHSNMIRQHNHIYLETHSNIKQPSSMMQKRNYFLHQLNDICVSQKYSKVLFPVEQM